MSQIQQSHLKEDIECLIAWMSEVNDNERLQTLEKKLRYLTELLESS